MDKITRRKFVNAAAIGAGAIVGLKGTTLAQVRQAAPSMIETTDALSKLTWNSFLPFVNTEFTFGEGGNAVILRLAEMKDSRPLRARSRRLGQENFVLKFQGSIRNPIKEGIYRVNHFNLGDFDLFITNHGQVGRVIHYSAVINRVLAN